MSSPRIDSRRAPQALRTLLDYDIADIAAEEHAAGETTAVNALMEHFGTRGEDVLAVDGDAVPAVDGATVELRYVVDALARCLDENERLRGELDAANDAVLELLTELEEAAERSAA